MFLVFGAFHFPFKIPFKGFKIVLFSALARRNSFGADLGQEKLLSCQRNSIFWLLHSGACRLHWGDCINVAPRCCCACSFIVFYTSLLAKKSHWSVCVIVALSCCCARGTFVFCCLQIAFWNGCAKVVPMSYWWCFSFFALSIFLLNFLLKSKSNFLWLWLAPGSGFGAGSGPVSWEEVRWGEKSWDQLRRWKSWGRVEMWREERRDDKTWDELEEVRQAEMRWHELRRPDMSRAAKRWEELSWDKHGEWRSWGELKREEFRWAEKMRKPRWHEKRWEQLRSAEKSRDKERRHEMRWDDMRWDKLRWEKIQPWKETAPEWKVKRLLLTEGLATPNRHSLRSAL